MFSWGFWSFVTMMIGLASNNVHATITAEEMASMKESMEPFFKQCIDELGITDEQVEEAVKSKGSKAEIDPCFMSCFFKKTGLFTSEGMYDVDKAMELTKPHIKNEEDLAIIDNIRKDCAKVNDEEVSDEDKGCDRAMMLFQCFKEHKDEIDLDQ